MPLLAVKVLCTPECRYSPFMGQGIRLYCVHGHSVRPRLDPHPGTGCSFPFFMGCMQHKCLPSLRSVRPVRFPKSVKCVSRDVRATPYALSPPPPPPPRRAACTACVARTPRGVPFRPPCMPLCRRKGPTEAALPDDALAAPATVVLMTQTRRLTLRGPLLYWEVLLLNPKRPKTLAVSNVRHFRRCGLTRTEGRPLARQRVWLQVRWYRPGPSLLLSKRGRRSRS